MSDLNALNLEPGEFVGGYELISRLGGGAMGSVWRVSDGGGQIYAMKILRDSLAEESAGDGMEAGPGDGGRGNSGGNQTGYGSGTGGQGHGLGRDQLTARERLRREAMALQKVRHPGVCGIVDMELDDSLAFIVTELIEGKNLRQDVAANGRYTGDDLERLARKLIDAVKAVHAAGIVHRDIKPTNVMVSASGPVLVDFGIAMGAGESHVTRTGLVMGTPGFIAPEIIDGAESDEVTDWWSLASVLAFSATGHPVFGTKPMMTVLEREASGNANLTGLPAGTMAALRSALDPDRRKRNSPDALLRAIALDALNPFAWEDAQGNQTGQVGSVGLAGQPNIADQTIGNPQDAHDAQEAPSTSGPQENGAMRPFDPSAEAETRVMAPAAANFDNPRSLWPQNDAGTQLLQPFTAPAPVEDADNAAGHTAAMPQTGATTGMPAPANQTGRAPTVSMQAPANQGGAPPRSHAACDSGSQLPLPQTAILPSAAGATAPASEFAPIFIPPAAKPLPAAPAQSQAPLQDPADIQQIQQPVVAPPNPADIKRAQLLTRGRVALWMLMIPVGLLAAGAPVIAFLAVFALLWMMFAVGFSQAAQLGREAKRGGMRKGSDAALRLATLPWHIVKALLAALGHAALLLAAAALITAAAAFVLPLPVARIYLQLRGWTIPIALLTGSTWSVSAAILGVAGALSWLASAFITRSPGLILGAGTLLTASPKAPPKARTDQTRTDQPQRPPEGNAAAIAAAPRKSLLRKRVLMPILWAVVTLTALVVLASNQSIAWEPLTSLASYV